MKRTSDHLKKKTQLNLKKVKRSILDVSDLDYVIKKKKRPKKNILKSEEKNSFKNQIKSEKAETKSYQTDFKKLFSDQVKQESREPKEHKIGNSNLPIYFKRNHIIESINGNQISIISGNTGCGKSTQLPLFLFEDSLKKNTPFKIICTQPRRLACVNIARRVKEEIWEYYQKINVETPQDYV
jgi:HrpA-like RNA helicase